MVRYFATNLRSDGNRKPAVLAFAKPISFVRPRRRLSSVPTADLKRRRAQGRSRPAVALPKHQTPTLPGPRLDGPEHSGSIGRSGRTWRATPISRRRNKAEKRHQLLGVRKTTYIADLRYKGDGDNERHTSQGLVGCHHHSIVQAGTISRNCCSKGARRIHCRVDHLKMILENDLLRRMIEGLLRQPAFMHFCPILPTREDPAMTEQKETSC